MQKLMANTLEPWLQAVTLHFQNAVSTILMMEVMSLVVIVKLPHIQILM